MNSPFEKAEQVESYLKILFFGESGVGKSTIALQFPMPVVIDTENGTSLYGGKFNFHVIHTADIAEIYKAVNWLLNNKHPYKTLVIDPITIYWDALQTKWSNILLATRPEEKGSGVKGEGVDQFYEFQQRDWALIKAEYKKFMRLLKDLKMNVVLTAHSKLNEKTKRAVFDAEKKTDTVFDTVIELFRNGKTRTAIALKDRNNYLPEEPFEISYQILEGYFGKTLLEREAQPVRLVSLAEADAFIELYTAKGIPQKRIDEKLQGEGVTALQELPFAILENWTKKLKEIKTKNP